jgi:hypothetical protein
MNKVSEYLILLFLSAMLVFTGCKTTEYPARVYLFQKDKPLPVNSVIYSLPRTVVRVQVEAVKTNWKKGPYYDFREKLLNISEGIENDQSEWALSGVDIHEYYESDPSQYYVIESDAPFVSNILQMTQAGLVLSPEQGITQKITTVKPPLRERPERMYFTELSVRENYKTVVDTVIQLIITDTGYVNQPVLSAHEEYKSLEERAEDAAETITELRLERFRILTGQVDNPPQGQAMEVTLAEITRMENEFLSLFIGKSYSEVYRAEFEIIPTCDMQGSAQVICRFSPEKGILPASDLSGLPVAIVFQGSEQIDPTYLSNPVPRKKNELPPLKLYYRLPDIVKVTVTDGRKTLGEKNVMIYQFGKMMQVLQNFILPGK